MKKQLRHYRCSIRGGLFSLNSNPESLDGQAITNSFYDKNSEFEFLLVTSHLNTYPERNLAFKQGNGFP
jgi:hypothetical protein